MKLVSVMQCVCYSSNIKQMYYDVDYGSIENACEYFKHCLCVLVDVFFSHLLSLYELLIWCKKHLCVHYDFFLIHICFTRRTHELEHAHSDTNTHIYIYIVLLHRLKWRHNQRHAGDSHDKATTTSTTITIHSKIIALKCDA